MRKNNKSYMFLKFSLDLLGYKKMITAADVFCNAIIFSHQAGVTYCIREILNGLEGTVGEALNNSIPYLAGILVVSLIRIGAIMACSALDAKRAYYYRGRLRINILKQLLRKKNIISVTGRSSSVFEVLDDDVPASTYPAELVTEVSGFIVYTIIALTMLLSINWQLTLFIFIPLSVAIYGVQRLSERMKEQRKRNREAHDTASTFLSDVADATLSIKTTGAADSVLNRYDTLNMNRRATVMKDAVFNERVSVLLNSSVSIGSAVMMFIAARLMTGDSFGIGDFSLFIAHLDTLADCTNRIVELIYESRKAEVSYERIIDVVDNDDVRALSEKVNIELNQALKVVSMRYPVEKFSSFEVKNLSFTYSREDGFNDVSFAVRPGELIAVAGGMASGKSTLLSVLMGLIPPDKGDMFWNGEPLDNANRTPKRIAGALQRGDFFAADIKTNLCLDMKTDDLSIDRALKIACFDGGMSGSADVLIKNIGNHGDKLSGGQRQRLALARMLIREAEVSIVDDCISALDEDTRKEVLRQLTDYLTETRRSLIIATNTRLFLESADNIIFMSGGHIEAVGNYQKLMQSCAAFQKVIA
jgi:ATP-binding cassette subfamily B protein